MTDFQKYNGANIINISELNLWKGGMKANQKPINWYLIHYKGSVYLTTPIISSLTISTTAQMPGNVFAPRPQ